MAPNGSWHPFPALQSRRIPEPGKGPCPHAGMGPVRICPVRVQRLRVLGGHGKTATARRTGFGILRTASTDQTAHPKRLCDRGQSGCMAGSGSGFAHREQRPRALSPVPPPGAGPKCPVRTVPRLLDGLYRLSRQPLQGRAGIKGNGPPKTGLLCSGSGIMARQGLHNLLDTNPTLSRSEGAPWP